ncbi:acyltransferase [soil metagenome]
MKNNRIEFTNTLRGLAAVTVIIHHLMINFWTSPATICNLLHITSNQQVELPLLVSILQCSPFYSGPGGTPSGTAMFFLISGFIIPFALHKTTTLSFLMMRIFRLWPTYLVGFAISLLSLKLLSFYFDSSFYLNLKSILSNIFFVNAMLSEPSIDGINWSLAIQIKFYLLVAFMPFLIKKSSVYLLLLSTLFVAMNFFKINFPSNLVAIVGDIKFSVVMITYMLIGISFYMHYFKKITLSTLVFNTFFILGCFFIQVKISPFFLHSNQHILGFSTALILFSIFYTCHFIKFSVNEFLLKSKFFHIVIENVKRFLEQVAIISYPLYVIHPITGYAYLKVFMYYFNMPYLALISCFLLISILAFLLHFLIEIPFNNLGKKIVLRISEIKYTKKSALENFST